MTIVYQYHCPQCGSVANQSAYCANCNMQILSPITEYSSWQSKSQKAALIDPDQPAWGLWSALGIWLLSVFFIVSVPLVITIAWQAWQIVQKTGVKITSPEQAMANPNFVLLMLTGTFFAQMLTLAIAYLLATRSSGRFWQAFGWHWHPSFKPLHAVAYTIAIYVAAVGISKILPHSETDLERLLKLSHGVRITIALLAVVTAPLVEEVVYRGILYPALKQQLTRHLSEKSSFWLAIAGVSFVFTAVHVPQYWGGWDVLVSLTILSFFLTVVRAYTKSLLPSYFIHLIFNGVQALLLILNSFIEKQS